MKDYDKNKESSYLKYLDVIYMVGQYCKRFQYVNLNGLKITAK